MLSVLIARSVDALARRLLTIGRGLVAVITGLVSIREPILAGADRPSVFASARSGSGAVLLSLERPV